MPFEPGEIMDDKNEAEGGVPRQSAEDERRCGGTMSISDFDGRNVRTRRSAAPGNRRSSRPLTYCSLQPRIPVTGRPML
jgi:hypothetical protein